MPQNIVRPFDAGGLRLLDRAIGRMLAYENQSAVRAVRREPHFEIRLNRDQAPRRSFCFCFSNLDISACEVYVLPFETNEFGRSQARESSDRKIKFRFFVADVQKISELRRREGPDLPAAVLRFRDVIRFSRYRFWQIAARFCEVEESYN